MNAIAPIVVPPWSYSSLNTFETCPKKYYHRYILKEKEPETEQSLYGTRVHEALEKSVGLDAPLPKQYQHFKPIVDVVRRKAKEPGVMVKVEAQFGVTRELKPCDFFAPNVWGRGKADIIITKNHAGWLGDYKTGKIKEKDDQLKIFSAFMFVYYPTLTNISANNIWLKDNKIGEIYQFQRDHAPVVWKEILDKVERVQRAADSKSFNPKPSGLCGWCPVKTCPYNTSDKRTGS